MSFHNCVWHILEIADLGDLLEVVVFGFHTHAPHSNQRPGPTHFIGIVHV